MLAAGREDEQGIHVGAREDQELEGDSADVQEDDLSHEVRGERGRAVKAGQLQYGEDSDGCPVKDDAGQQRHDP